MKEGFSYFTDTHLTVIGLMIFFIWFLAMCYWVLRVVPKQKYLMMSEIPLQNVEGEL